MALLQPAPEVYELFDDILLMAEGHVIFHGPKEDVLPFLRAWASSCPPARASGTSCRRWPAPNSLNKQGGWQYSTGLWQILRQLA